MKFFNKWFVAFFFTMLFGNIILAAKEDKKLKVLMVTWWGTTEADTGFKDRAKELGLNLETTHIDLKQDKALMGKIFRETKWTDYDFVYTYATPPSKGAAVSIAGAVPQLFVMVSYPIEAGLVNSWEKSGKKITGISNNISLAKQYEAVLKVKQVKNVGILFNPIEDNSDYARLDFEKESAARGIKTTTYRTGSDIEQVKKTCEEIVKDFKAGKIDGLFLPAASFFTSNAAKFVPILSDGGVFTFTPIDRMVSAGATIGILFNREKLGRMGADRMKEILDGKLKIEDSPTLMDNAPEIVFNKKSVDLLGLKLPADAKFAK